MNFTKHHDYYRSISELKNITMSTIIPLTVDTTLKKKNPFIIGVCFHVSQTTRLSRWAATRETITYLNERMNINQSFNHVTILILLTNQIEAFNRAAAQDEKPRFLIVAQVNETHALLRAQTCTKTSMWKSKLDLYFYFRLVYHRWLQQVYFLPSAHHWRKMKKLPFVSWRKASEWTLRHL